MNKSSIALIAVLSLLGGITLSWILNNNKPIDLEVGLWFGDQSRALPEFELVDHRNARLQRADLTGKWNLLFFGFTHCPDICPMGLQTISDMVAAIDDPEIVQAVQIYFVSVDPERDRPEVLAEYVTYFNPNFIGATAEMEKLRPFTRALGIAHEITNRQEGNPNYDVSHSASIVLVNPKVEYAGLFSAPHDALAMARDLTRIVANN